MTQIRIYNPRSWIDSRLTVLESPISGKGIFTTADIKKDEVIMIFGGLVVKKKDLDEKLHRIQTAFPIDQDTFIVLPISDTEDTVDEYLNHSCDPTAWLIDDVTVVARRDIRKTEEITVDAATWDMDPEWLYSEDGLCYCNAPNCRKNLRPTDYQIIDLQRTYQGHFSPYIQKQIDSLVS